MPDEYFYSKSYFFLFLNILKNKSFNELMYIVFRINGLYIDNNIWRRLFVQKMMFERVHRYA